MNPKAAQYPIEKAEALLAELRVGNPHKSDLQLVREACDHYLKLCSGAKGAATTLSFVMQAIMMLGLVARYMGYDFRHSGTFYYWFLGLCLIAAIYFFCGRRTKICSVKLDGLQATRALFESIAPQSLEEVADLQGCLPPQKPSIVTHQRSASSSDH